MKVWLENLDIPEKVLGCILAIGAILALLPKLLRVLLAFYNGARYTLDIREHMGRMEKRILDRLTQIDDGQANQIETKWQMLDADIDAIWFQSDPKGHTQRVSKTWTAWTGLSTDSARGSGWENAVHPDDRPRVVQGWQLAVDHQRDYTDTFHYVDVEGRRFPVIVRAHMIRRSDGTVLNYFGSVRKVGAHLPSLVLGAAAPRKGD